MEQEIPTYLQTLNFAFRVLTPVAIVAGLWLAIRRSTLPTSQHTSTWAGMTALFLGWFAVAWAFGQANVFAVPATGMPLIQFALLPPIIVGLALLLGTARGRGAPGTSSASWTLWSR